MGFSIERSARYETVDILGREVTIRVKFSVTEMGFLGRELDRFQGLSEKINKNASKEQIDSYTKCIDGIVNLLVKGEEDKKYMSSIVLNDDNESDDIIDMKEFTELVSYAMKMDDKEAEVDSGKASDG